MAKKKTPKHEEIDEQKAREEEESTEELRETSEGRGDGGNPQWWKNEGSKPGEVH
jgi:hypothetical protein